MIWLGVVILISVCVMAGTTTFWLYRNRWWDTVMIRSLWWHWCNRFWDWWGQPYRGRRRRRDPR